MARRLQTTLKGMNKMAKMKSVKSYSDMVMGIEPISVTSKMNFKYLGAVGSTPLLALLGGAAAFASDGTEAVPASVTGMVAGTSLKVLASALDPVIQILVAISLPVASIVMVGGCFYFMFGNSEKAWSTIQNAGLGYILIQMSPLFIKVLKEIGSAI